MIFVCGSNSDNQLGETSNIDGQYSSGAIYPPLKSKIDPYSILCFSCFAGQSILITQKGILKGIGNNKNYEISKSLKPKIYDDFELFVLKDQQNRIYTPMSAVLGSNYILYLAFIPESKINQLICSYSQNHLFLNINGHNPISIYGGHNNSAAIDSEGNIIFIDEYIMKKPKQTHLPVFSLPNNEVAICVSCCFQFIIALSSTNHVYVSTTEKEGMLSFTEATELRDEEIVFINGVAEHCFAVSKNGRVFGIGTNLHGVLGLDRQIYQVDKFTEITSLSEHFICEAYAGSVSSFYKTKEGKLLATGWNIDGQLSINEKPSSKSFFDPVETTINDVSSCFVGAALSVFFIGITPPFNPNRIVQKTTSEIVRLRIENSLLRNKIKEIELKEQKKKPLTIYGTDYINSLLDKEPMGSSENSKVFKVEIKKKRMLKILDTNRYDDKSFENLKKLMTEIEIINKIRHKNVIRGYGICFGDDKQPPSILLEYVEHNLLDVIKSMSNRNKVTAIYEISAGMAAVHSLNIIHRNLKPENILIDANGHVKISDFGMSWIGNDNSMLLSKTTGVGTFQFMSPEILNERSDYDEKVDVYSFGVIVYFILTGGNLPKISVSGVAKGWKAQIPVEINSLSRNLILNCWSFEPSQRPSFQNIVELIEKNNFALIDDVDEINKFIK